MTSSVGDCVVGVPVELPGITGNDPSTPVGGFRSGVGFESSFPILGIWMTSSTPLFLRIVRLHWAGDVRRGAEVISYGVKPFSTPCRFLDGHQLQSGQ
jgi:hypothetical protein